MTEFHFVRFSQFNDQTLKSNYSSANWSTNLKLSLHGLRQVLKLHDRLICMNACMLSERKSHEFFKAGLTDHNVTFSFDFDPILIFVPTRTFMLSSIYLSNLPPCASSLKLYRQHDMCQKTTH